MVGRRFADCVPAWEEAPVIHPVARGGPECRAVLGGSINPTAVLLEREEEARHRSELARACTSRRDGARKSGVSWRRSRSSRRLVVVEDPASDDDNQADDPESIARWIAAVDAIPPLEMTAEEEAEWQAARKAQRDFEKSNFNERADKLREMFE